MDRNPLFGVVDPKDLKIYGCNNIYICDSSIIPSVMSSSFWKVIFCVGLIAFDKKI